MAHRRVPWDKGGNRGHPTQEGEQVGVKTFGDFGSFQSHSPSRAAAAKPRRGRSPRVLRGEAVPLRRGAAFARQCCYRPLTLALSPKGRGGSSRSLRGWRAKPRRGRSPRVLRGEAVPFTRGTALHQAMTLPTPHPNPLPQGERGSSRSLRGWRAKPRRGPRPRVLHGEAVPLRRGTALHQAMPLPTPHPSPLPQGERGQSRNPVEDSVLASCTAKPCH